MSALRGHNISRFLRWGRGAGSQIDASYPIFGEPETATVRRQFATASQEISALQNAVEEIIDLGTGPSGPPGPPNTLVVGATVTGAANTLADVTISGTAPNQTLHFTIPRGIQGDPGVPGQDSTVAGPPGPANALTVSGTTTGAANTLADVTISGTAPNQALSFTIPRGDTGQNGAPGQAATIAVGLVSTGAAGSGVQIAEAGGSTAQARVYNFTIPRGDQGVQGSPGTTTPVNITAGAGLVTTPAAGITATGSVALANVVTAGSVTNANITYDAHGRITAATSGTAGGVTSLSATTPVTVSASTGAINIALSGPVGAGSSSALATETGKIFVNLNAAETFPSSGAAAQFTGADAGADASTTVAIDAVGTPTLRLRKLMGSVAQTTQGTASLPVNNTQLGMIEIQGYNNVGLTKMGTAAQIRTAAAGPWSGSNYGAAMQFWTVRQGSTSITVAMSIGGSGGLIVGGAPDEGAGSVSAEKVFAAGEDLRQLIQDLEDRIIALGG